MQAIDIMVILSTWTWCPKKSDMTEYLKRCEEPKRRRKVEGEVISAIQSLWMQEEPSHHLRRFVQCDDEFYFNGYLTGQRIHPHRRSSVPANGIPEYEQQKVRAH